MKKIHQSAIIEDGAVIGDGVEIGPYCYVGAEVKIGDGTVLMQGAQLHGDSDIGKNNQIFPYAVIGTIPQDLKFHGEKVQLVMGDNNKVREHVMFNPGTEGGGNLTKIGSNSLFMAYTHIAHDCILGDQVILANNATLAGHVELGNGVVVGGMTPVHQFVKIGDYAMIGGASALSQDVPPYCLAEGNKAYLRGLNLNGLRRWMERDEINLLKSAYATLFNEAGIPREKAMELSKESASEHVQKLCAFVVESKRGIPLKKDKK
jgi:UDP-N-acetylglucosamine acyltransferase